MPSAVLSRSRTYHSRRVLAPALLPIDGTAAGRKASAGATSDDAAASVARIASIVFLVLETGMPLLGQVVVHRRPCWTGCCCSCSRSRSRSHMLIVIGVVLVGVRVGVGIVGVGIVGVASSVVAGTVGSDS